MGWIQLSSQDRPKRQGTVCPISPKGEARTLRQYVPSIPKAKLGHRVHLVLEFCTFFWGGGGRKFMNANMLGLLMVFINTYF